MSTDEQKTAGKDYGYGFVPDKMRALFLVKFTKGMTGDINDYKGCFEVREVDTPVPKSGEILVRIERSPVNPSDLSALMGTYNAAQREELPCQVGFEASGTVVRSGGGLPGWMNLGKRVAIPSTGGGRMWAEYAVAPALNAIQLPHDVSWEAGCSCFVNPLSALAFLEIAQAGGHKAIVHTPGASALGKMTFRLFKEHNLKVINIVRRQGQVDELKKIGADLIVNTSEEDWAKKLRDLCKEHNATLGFDAVAGPQTGQILGAMPKNSTLRVYGGMSKAACANVSPTDLIFSGKTLTGFWLTAHIRHKSLLAKASFKGKVAQYLNSALATTFRQTFTIDQAAEALSSYCGNMTAGKVAFNLRPSDDDPKLFKQGGAKEQEQEQEQEEQQEEEEAKE
eukprot:TRINITY_DN65862_c7_g2_i1.p1 TRINITY_DN65862_c7_g2~~TRINITY_DN65862_c7_g2_i1.p1  ORF type:complete len:395 (+),score=233.26 TRINITY_DN65862_c7_g2_i1:69-1253(+)